MPEKLKGVCRLCLSKEGLMFPIFRKDIKSDTPFRIKILSCASIEIFADDELPSEICHICAHQVEKSFQFRSLCENSDATLRSQLSHNQNEVFQETISMNALTLENSDVHNAWPEKKNCFDSEKNNDLPVCFQENRVCEREGNDLGVYICFACSLSFASYDTLMDHVEKSHPQITLFPCKECKLHFTQFNEYKVHLSMKHALICNKCDHVFKHQKNLELHLKSHLAEAFPCQFCKKLFDKHIDLKKHELHHLENMCKFCCKVFGSKEEYSEHLKICNGAYSCKFCSENFQLKKDLIIHVNNSHENLLVHKCKKCNKPFEKWADLQQHTCTAQLEENLICKYCQQTFTDLSLLESHISLEHNEELVCKFCAKTFTLKSALRRHEKSHSGLKPYQCKYCPRKFKDNSTCIVHIRTHTGEHPFQCQECHKDFKQLANLKMHTYRHHKVSNKVIEEKAQLLREAEQIYDQIYNTPVVDSFSDGDKSFQQIDSSITSNFN